jgi:lipoic acid synthetase
VDAVRRHAPGAKVEVLTPDFNGNMTSIDTVVHSGPDVFGHNIETVPRLYPVVRPGADYRRSLSLAAHIKKTDSTVQIKSGLMLGLGEQESEVLDVLRDLRATGCDCITIGQYLQPSRSNLPVREYVRPELFEKLRRAALSLGFLSVASSPLVRSSMNAEELYYNGCTV